MTLSLRRLDWILLLAVLALVALSALLVWSATSHRVDLTDGDSTAYLRKQLVNIVIGLVLLFGVTVADHRWVRIVAPFVYLLSVSGLVLVLTMGSTINGSRSWLRVAGPVDPAVGVREARGGHRHGAGPRRALVGPVAASGRHLRRAADAGDRRRAGRADPAPARPRDDARALRHRLRRPGRVRRPPALAGRRAAVGRLGRRARPRRWRPEGLPGGPLPGLREPRPRPARRGLQRRAGPDRDRQRRAVRPGAVPRLPDPGRLRAGAADRLRLHGGGGGAGARWAPGCSSACSAWSSGAPWSSPAAPRTSSAGSPPPASPAGSASRPSRTSACASASCPSPAYRCRSCRTAGRRSSRACSPSASCRTSTCARRRGPTSRRTRSAGCWSAGSVRTCRQRSSRSTRACRRARCWSCSPTSVPVGRTGGRTSTRRTSRSTRWVRTGPRSPRATRWGGSASATRGTPRPARW